MDGFHYSNAVLRTLGRASRKGAPDTFDVDGYATLLERLRLDDGRTVYAPGFDRERDEPVAGDLAVPASARIVITEGNYLLLPDPGWGQVRPLLDEVWYVDVDESLRLKRLIGRHQQFGKDEAAARAWATGPDAANARLIAATRATADLIIRY
jgi:pantothenate kinase